MELKDNKHYPSLIGRSIEELEIISTSIGEPPYRGRQLFDWIYRKKVDDITKMTDLPKLSQDKLKIYPMHPLKILKTNNSLSKKTQKYLFITKNGNKIESVLMKKGNYTTLCLSTQVGCAVDCSFCATAKMGFTQNLSAGEIIDQYLQLVKLSDNQITNVVFMGMGEPFLNYENCIAAARLLNHQKGINLAGRVFNSPPARAYYGYEAGEETMKSIKNKEPLHQTGFKAMQGFFAKKYGGVKRGLAGVAGQYLTPGDKSQQ